MLTPEQLARRRAGLGATDVVAICGLSPWASAWDIYSAKVDPDARRPAAGLAARIGSHLEALIADLYAERTGDTVHPCDTMAHPDHPWALCTPDRVVAPYGVAASYSWRGDLIASWRGDAPPRRLVEIKRPTLASARDWGHEAMGAEGVPAKYFVQCQWQMLVTDIHECDLVALIGDEAIRVYRLQRDEAMCSALFDRARSFWFDHVLTRTPPPLDGSDAARRHLETLFAKPTRERRRADGAAECLARDYLDAKRAAEEAEARKATIANHLRAAIGEHAGLYGEGWAASWSEQAGGIDYARLVRDLKITTEQIEQYRRPGFRALRVTAKGEK